jgi:hypothetical protein
VTKEGGFSENFLVFTTFQYGPDNFSQGTLEKKVLNVIRRVFNKDLLKILRLKASPGLPDKAASLISKQITDQVKSAKSTVKQTKLTSRAKVSTKYKSLVGGSLVSIPASFRSTKTGLYINKKEGIESHLKIKNLINAALPETIAGNMGGLKLNYRTGRFARGGDTIKPQVLRITPTQGSPEAIYTYGKFPYQTFEPGFKQGSTTRDPRVIIEESIREIAIKQALGRFTMRRV